MGYSASVVRTALSFRVRAFSKPAVCTTCATCRRGTASARLQVPRCASVPARAAVPGPRPVPVQMWQERVQSRCRCGSGEPSPGADGAGVSPVPGQMWPGLARSPGQTWQGAAQPCSTRALPLSDKGTGRGRRELGSTRSARYPARHGIPRSASAYAAMSAGCGARTRIGTPRSVRLTPTGAQHRSGCMDPAHAGGRSRKLYVVRCVLPAARVAPVTAGARHNPVTRSLGLMAVDARRLLGLHVRRTAFDREPHAPATRARRPAWVLGLPRDPAHGSFRPQEASPSQAL